MASEDKYYIINGTLYHADQLDELYHYGRPGMEWGKHLPGTDWWKEKVGNISKHFKSQYRAGISGAGTNYQIGSSSYGSNYGTSKRVGLKDKAKAGIGAALSTAKYASSKTANFVKNNYKKLPGHLANEAKNIGKNVREDFRDAGKALSKKLKPILSNFYSKASSANFEMNGATNLSHLESRMAKEFSEAAGSYQDAILKGTFGSTANAFIQSAQYNVLAGLNNMLKSMKIDDDVERLINKFKRSSSTASRNPTRGRNSSSQTYMNK